MAALPALKPKILNDGTLAIAVGRSRKETKWKNKETTWSELLLKLSETTRTRESAAEYMKLPKTQRDELKDVGGYVGGTLKGGRRKADAVQWRQLITLDADYIEGNLWALVDLMYGFACAAYSTHSHTPDKPRLRLVIPLTRPVTPDEYPAIARRLAADLGINYFDGTTYEPHRLMYWPSTAADGEYIFEYQDLPWLDPDKVLARYEDWTDPTFWPESDRQKAQLKRDIAKQGDPLAKAGIVGAFCRTYSIPDAIDKYLTDIYTPAGEGRFTYIPGSCAGGLVTYDGEAFAFSHHGTDPCSGKLVNAFDLVRIHLFGEQDENADQGVPVTKLPSWKAMLDFCQADEQVRETQGEEILARAQEDFATEENWLKRLEYDKKGNLEPSLGNLVLILRHDPMLQEIAYNAHKDTVVLTGQLPWRKPTDWKGAVWCDDDDASLRVYIEKVYKIWVPAKQNDALAAVSHERAFHPVREYLEALPEWDGIPRLEEILIDYLGAEDSAYVRAVSKKTLVAAVARVMNPGCQFDYMLVLNGPQGIGKSTLFYNLSGSWYSDSMSLADTHDKTAAEKLQGYWIMEIGELAGIRKAEVEAIKAFITRRRDIYRPSYGRRTVEHPRQCIIVGSTNNDTGFLRDSTGNRRFWPVRVSGAGADRGPWTMATYDIEQIWAEALAAYREGEALILTGEVEKEAHEQQKAAMEADDRVDYIRDFLERKLPDDWEERSLAERRDFIHGTDFGQEPEGLVERDRVCIAEIWCELYRRDRADIKRLDVDELHRLIHLVGGWQKYEGNRDGKLRFKIYGMQRAYQKMVNISDADR